MNKEKITYASIVIPVYNGEQYVERCIDSCINQKTSYKYEIIIVNDGSTDNTAKELKQYKYHNKVHIYNIEHAGISNALNYGISNSKGKYIIRMDVDDEMYDDRVNYQIHYMETHKDVDVLCSNIDRYYNDELYKFAPELELIKSNISHSDLLNKDLNYNWICHPAVCFKKKIFDTVYANEHMFYNSEYDGSEDYELWLRLIDKYDCNITSDIHKVLKYNIAKIKLPSLDQKILSKYYDELLYGKTFGIYYIATGIYKNDFPRFINSLKNFFPNNYKKVILISDGLEEYKNYDITNISIEHHYLCDYPWPIVTLFKMKYILMYPCDCDYVFYFNANSEILPIKDYSWFNKDKLNLAYHKDWFAYLNSSIFLEPWMDNPNSVSYIGTDNYTYVQAAFFGGPSKIVYNMCKEVNEMIAIDLCNNIIPRYHDETYLNKYNILHENESNISNVLISQIIYNINDGHDYENTQFIILHENIYNVDDNHKKDKNSNQIKQHQLKTLYNYDNIYEITYDKLRHSKVKYNSNNILIISIKNDNADYIKYLEEIHKFTDNYIVLSYASNTCINNYLYNSNLHKYFIYERLKVLEFVAAKIKSSYEIIELMYYYDYNLMYYWKLYNYIINYFESFSHLIYVNDSILTNIDYIKTLFEYDYGDNDLLLNNFVTLNINNFDHNKIIKKFNLFKYKYHFKNQIVCDIKDYFIMSHNALTFLWDEKHSLKNEIFSYSAPTLLMNNGYNVNQIYVSEE